MRHIIWRKSLRKKRSAWHPGCWGNTLLIILNSRSQHLSLPPPDSTLPGIRDHQIWYSCGEFLFIYFCEGTPLLNGIRQNLFENTLSQDQTVSNFSWISTTWINFSPPLHVAWRLLRDRIQLVLMYFTCTLVLRWILWQCFRTEVSFWVAQHSLLHHQARYWNFDIQIALSTNIAKQHSTSSTADSITS